VRLAGGVSVAAQLSNKRRKEHVLFVRRGGTAGRLTTVTTTFLRLRVPGHVPRRGFCGRGVGRPHLRAQLGTPENVYTCYAPPPSCVSVGFLFWVSARSVRPTLQNGIRLFTARELRAFRHVLTTGRERRRRRVDLYCRFHIRVVRSIDT